MRLKKYEIRYLCITTVISFLWVVMLSYLSQSKDINQILGNFSPSKSLKLDVQHIMQWNLAVLFPTLIANNYFIKEMGNIRYYTMVRSKRIKDWYSYRSFFICIICIFYILTVIVYTFGSHNSHIAKDFECLFSFCFHTLIMAFFSVLIYIHYKKEIKFIILFYLFIEGILLVLGHFVPQLGYWFLPYLGMSANVVRGTFECEYILFKAVIIITILFTGAFAASRSLIKAM